MTFRPWLVISEGTNMTLLPWFVSQKMNECLEGKDVTERLTYTCMARKKNFGKLTQAESFNKSNKKWALELKINDE